MSAIEEVVVGIDIGGTGTRFVMADPDTLNVLGRVSVATPSCGTAEVLRSFLCEQMAQVTRGRRPVAVGIGASGPVDTAGIIRNPDTLPAFTDLPLQTMLAGAVDGPVMIDNDAVCAALAERRVGAAQHAPRSVHVTLGTGIGVCLLDGDRPFRLPDGTHPEGGHLSVSTASDRCYCGRRNCWEQAASRRTLQRAASGFLGLAPDDRTAVQELAGLAAAADPGAVAVFDAYGAAVADGLGNVLALYGPTLVVLGGSGAAWLELFRPGLERVLSGIGAWVAPYRVVQTGLDDFGGAIGGACLVASPRSA